VNALSVSLVLTMMYSAPRPVRGAQKESAVRQEPPNAIVRPVASGLPFSALVVIATTVHSDTNLVILDAKRVLRERQGRLGFIVDRVTRVRTTIKQHPLHARPVHIDLTPGNHTPHTVLVLKVTLETPVLIRSPQIALFVFRDLLIRTPRSPSRVCRVMLVHTATELHVRIARQDGSARLVPLSVHSVHRANTPIR